TVADDPDEPQERDARERHEIQRHDDHALPARVREPGVRLGEPGRRREPHQGQRRREQDREQDARDGSRARRPQRAVHDRAANSTTTERASVRYLRTGTGGAFSHGTMSCGESCPASIQRRHCPPSPSGGSSKSRGSHYAFRVMWTSILSLRSSPVDAMLCASLTKPGWSMSMPCQALFAARIISVRGSRRRSCSTSRRSRRALSRVTNRCTSACFPSSVQSSQLVSLSWQ